MTIPMWVATAAWCCLVFGCTQRKNRTVHVPVMVTGILIDVALVLYLQVTRSAVQTALEFSLSLYEQIHILLSTIALVLYIPVLILGSKLVRGVPGIHTRSRHIKVATTALIFRTLGFIFMFSMWKS